MPRARVRDPVRIELKDQSGVVALSDESVRAVHHTFLRQPTLVEAEAVAEGVEGKQLRPQGVIRRLAVRVPHGAEDVPHETRRLGFREGVIDHAKEGRLIRVHHGRGTRCVPPGPAPPPLELAAAAPALVASAAACSAMHTATPRLMASWNAGPDVAGAAAAAESNRATSVSAGRM